MTVDIIGNADNGTVSVTVTGGTVQVVADADAADVTAGSGDTVEIIAPAAGTPITASPDGPVETAATGLQGPPGPPGPAGDASLIGHPTYVQTTQPADDGPYVWWQTDETGAPVTMWVEDGQP